MDKDYFFENLQILPITKDRETEAKKLIYEGLAERFDFLDDSLNPDLKNIVDFYILKSDIFIIGIYNEKLICTGALIKENDQTGRIVRMYVKKEYRRMGIAKYIIKILENYGNKKKFTTIVL